MKQTKEDQAIALMYESISRETTPEQQTKFKEYMAKHAALRKQYDQEFEIELGDSIYTVYADINYERKAIDHEASIGHYGVSGKDVYGTVPVGIDRMVAFDYNPDTDTETEVTDPSILKAIAGEVQSKLEDMEARDIGYSSRVD